MLDSKQETSGQMANLRGGLEAADPATLLLSLVQLRETALAYHATFEGW